MTILDVLADLGQGTLAPLWIPVLAWTIMALPAAWAVKRWGSSALLRYRLLQATLFALPLGIIAAAVLPSSGSLLPARTPGVAIRSGEILVELGASSTEATSPPALPELLGVILGAATALVAVVAMGGLARLTHEWIRCASLPDRLQLTSTDALQRECERLREHLRVQRPVSAMWTVRDVVPMTLGPRQPTVVLPDALQSDSESRRMALMHELVHMRRYDDVAALAERVLGALAGAHPLVRHLLGRLSVLREEACDAAVLNAPDTRRATYARLLLAFADRPPAPTGPLLLAESPSSLKTRLHAMRSRSSSPSSSLTRLLTTGLALLLVGGVVACSDSLSPSADSSPADQATSSTSADAFTPPKKLDAPPRPKGGMKALQEAVTYPEVVAKAGIEGRVFVEFVVDASGAVQEATAITPDDADAATHEDLQRAAVRAVESLTFTPGRKDGQAVKTKMTLPITFRLNDRSPGPASSDADVGASTTESDPSAGVRTTSSPGSSESLFQKAGIQILKVLINADGDVLLGRKPVEVSTLASVAKQQITRDAARAVLIPDANAPPKTVEAVRAQLQQLPLQEIYLRTDADE